MIANAVFARQSERLKIAAIPDDLSVPFDGVWLQVPIEVMKTRVSERKNDISDAGVEVIDQQFGYDLGTIAG